MGHSVRLDLPEHGLLLSPQERLLAERIMPAMLAGGFDPPWVRTLAIELHVSEPLVRTTMARLAQRNELHQVVKDLYYPAATLAELARIARELASNNGGEVRAAEFRDATGIGRKRAIQVLEFFDRAGLLQRVCDVHKLCSGKALFEATSL